MVASVGVRNRATVGGNLCSAVPCCDSGPALLVYGATLHVATPRGTKRIPMSKWFLGPRKTALALGSLVTAVVSHGQTRGRLCQTEALSGRRSCAGQRGGPRGRQRRLARGLWFRRADTYSRTEGGAFAEGRKKPAAALLTKAMALAEAEVAPITDIRGSMEYRRLMVGVMLKRSVRLAARRLAGRGPDYGVNILEEDA